MTRVGYVFNHGDVVGGGEVSFIDLVDEIRKHGIEPIAIVPKTGAVKSKLEVKGIEVFVHPWPTLRGAGILKWFPTIHHTANRFRGLELELVHTNGARCTLYAAAAARRERIPCLWHVRVLERDRILDRLRAKLVTTVVANSRAVEDSLKTILPTRVRVHVIYNGIRLEEIKAAKALSLQKLFALEDTPVVLAVGRLSREKGWRDLIQASSLLHSKAIFHSVVAVGSALDKEYRQELKGLIQKMELPSWTWAGERDDVWSLMKSATVLATPSHREAFGRVVAEAWACGLPVVATRTGGLSELVRSGVDGLLVSPSNPEELAGALERILRSPELAEGLSKAGAQRAGDFTLSRHAAELAEVYREILVS
jgi:glycosyltransferase involved in cell wall biosynthesis